MILLQDHKVAGFGMDLHFRWGILEVHNLMSEALAKSLHRDDANGIVGNGDNAFGAFL